MITTETNAALAKRAAEWVRSPEGQKVILESKEAADAVIAELDKSSQPMSWADWNTPFI